MMTTERYRDDGDDDRQKLLDALNEALDDRDYDTARNLLADLERYDQDAAAEQQRIIVELHAERDWLDACARERAEREAAVDEAGDPALNDGAPF